MKVALFGGTFDPVHNGHVNAAVEVIEQDLVQEVWFVPVFWHAFKENVFVTGLSHRKKMIELAISGKKGIRLLDLGKNPVFTIDTVLEAKRRFPEKEFFWLMGTNLVKEFSSWKEPKSILEEAKLILFPVPGSEQEKNPLIDSANPIMVKAEPVDLSSTVVRQKLQCNEDVSCLIGKRVLAYLVENKLYS